jgi:hypothetical protein
LLAVVDQVQGCPPFCAGPGDQQRAIGKVKGRQTVSCRYFASPLAPMETAGNHQMQHQKIVLFKDEYNSFSDSHKSLRHQRLN